jgi:PAS domain-containing protein
VRCAAISAAAQDAIIMLDEDGCIAHSNEAASRIFGYSCEEAVAMNLHELLAPARFLEAHRQAFGTFVRAVRARPNAHVTPVCAGNGPGHAVAGAAPRDDDTGPIVLCGWATGRLRFTPDRRTGAR